MMYNENSELWLKLNAITVDRIGLGHRALTRYDHTLFGQKVFWVGVASLRPDLIYNYVDKIIELLAVDNINKETILKLLCRKQLF